MVGAGLIIDFVSVRAGLIIDFVTVRAGLIIEFASVRDGLIIGFLCGAGSCALYPFKISLAKRLF